MRRIAFILFMGSILSCGIAGQGSDWKLYPELYDSVPTLQSPEIISDTMEIVVIRTKDNKFGIVPVTVENGTPLLYSYRVNTQMGKDEQLFVDARDFPHLAKTGLHDPQEIENTEMITGIPVKIINYTARPSAYSYSGFIAEDEDILSVLKGDNYKVRKMGLTHPQLAKPLFHIWNIILLEHTTGNWSRFNENINGVLYNGNWLNFSASSSKGWQISIFFDEVQGRHDIHIDRELTSSEEQYLNDRYAYLGDEALEELKLKLTNLNFSEMLPYYIIRYGFYEGHTDYRCDPVSTAFIFGLKSLEEIDTLFDGDLYRVLTAHYTSE